MSDNNSIVTVSSLFAQDKIKKRFSDIMGKKAEGFITSVLQIVNNSNLLKKADPKTILTAAATAATLDLPINQSLGFAWIVPYKGQAQFQLGWKGFVQLAQRTGQYHRINVVSVYRNQFKSYNALSEELDADFLVVGEGNPIGYAAYFRLTNGFEKLVYWTADQVKAHANKYSKTYNKKSNGKLIHSPWNDPSQFDAMAKKTVLKNMLSKWGIMSIEMQTAVVADQSVQIHEGNYSYVDNKNPDSIDLDEIKEQSEKNRALKHIENAKSIDDLNQVASVIEEFEIEEEFNKKYDQLSKSEKS